MTAAVANTLLPAFPPQLVPTLKALSDAGAKVAVVTANLS